MIMPINSQSRETRETRDFQGFACKNAQLFRDKLEYMLNYIQEFNNGFENFEEIKVIML